MADVLDLALPFFGLILLGVLAARVRPIPREGLAWMNTFIVYVALPALFFQLLSRTPVEQLASFGFIFATTLGTYLIFVLSFTIGMAGERSVPIATIRGFAGAYGNIGYMGPGLAIAAFGEEAVVPVALVFCFDNTMHFVLAPLLMALGGQSDGGSKLELVSKIGRKVLTHPFIMATIVGVGAAVFEVNVPSVANRLLTFLSGAAAPCALFAMGVTVALAPKLKVPAVAWPLTFTKLAIHPLLIWLLLGWIGEFERVWVFSAVLLAALPSATNVFVIAQQYDVWVEEASSMVVVTTVFSIVTVTGLLYAITTGWLPADPFP